MTLREEILGRQDCAEFVTSKNCQAIAELLSVGRVKVKSTMITERGLRSSLSITAASQLLRLLKDCSETEGVPAWLSPLLLGLGVPESMHLDYAEAFASAYGWLRQDAGIDIGSAATQGMLDIIAASNPSKFGATVATIKTLAMTSNPVTDREVALALFNDDGTTK
jgi:hypothetical protein